jgi:hypothetical protein
MPSGKTQMPPNVNLKQLFAAGLYKTGNRLIKRSNRQPPPNRFLAFAGPGHFYSPIPDAEYVDKNAAALFSDEAASLPGIDMNPSGQRELVQELLKYANDYEPPANAEAAAAAGANFYRFNPFFKELDAYLYYGLLRHRRPRKIYEVGSGFTSALAVDVCGRFLKPPPEFIFVDPFPERLHAIFGSSHRAGVAILEKPVQQVDKNLFLQLEGDDFLFIDSSHVSKIGSDVNYLFFEVLPRLKKGVIIHVHDIFWPFEYPKPWLDEGRSWNEAYLLRALLSNTSRYRVLCSSSYLAKRQADLLEKFPRWVAPEESSSIWLEVIA